MSSDAKRIGALCLAGALVVLILMFCKSLPNTSDDADGQGQSIVVCAERIPIDGPVVLWSDPGGYDAYQTTPHFSETGPTGLRYAPGRGGIEDDEMELEALRETIDLLVLHYDACGFSRRCFEVLHDQRKLSAHFLLDVDGTLYQTLDLQDQAWHGRYTNARSIGIEIAQIGASAPGSSASQERWYELAEGRLRLVIPPEHGAPHLREPGPYYSARDEPVRGEVHGRLLEQRDFTPQQYETLVKLTAALHEVFPKIALDAPRDERGRVRMDELSREEMASFRGIIGHHHITSDKIDPGPAFDWERFLAECRARSRNAE